MDRSRWFFHPVFVFVCSVIALGTSLFLYIYWYVEVSTGLEAVVQKFNIKPDQVLASQTWVVILVLSILVGIIMMGIFMIFVYSQKTLQLYRLQHNFINNFTHELKTPVTSLKLYLETFLKYDLSRDEQVKYLNYMVQDARRLSDNINCILNLARIETKSYKGEFILYDLVETTEEFYLHNQHLFQNCDIHIHHPPATSFLYRINLSLFEMLLMNLFTNAIKYNKSDLPVIDVTFEAKKKFIYIRFKDNGIGLEKNEIKKIFRKFYQVGKSDDMSAKGSGLGLYMAQSIARIHKGKMIAKSNGPGKGSVFTLIMPIKN